MNVEEHMNEIIIQCNILDLCIKGFIEGHGDNAKKIIAIQLENILGLTYAEGTPNE